MYVHIKAVLNVEVSWWTKKIGYSEVLKASKPCLAGAVIYFKSLWQIRANSDN